MHQHFYYSQWPPASGFSLKEKQTSIWRKTWPDHCENSWYRSLFYHQGRGDRPEERRVRSVGRIGQSLVDLAMIRSFFKYLFAFSRRIRIVPTKLLKNWESIEIYPVSGFRLQICFIKTLQNLFHRDHIWITCLL